jgi:hypothetical protein
MRIMIIINDNNEAVAGKEKYALFLKLLKCTYVINNILVLCKNKTNGNKYDLYNVLF